MIECYMFPVTIVEQNKLIGRDHFPAVRPIVCLIRYMDLGVTMWLTLLSVPFESCSPLANAV
jgi:hypothetical protein